MLVVEPGSSVRASVLKLMSHLSSTLPFLMWYVCVDALTWRPEVDAGYPPLSWVCPCAHLPSGTTHSTHFSYHVASRCLTQVTVLGGRGLLKFCYYHLTFFLVFQLPSHTILPGTYRAMYAVQNPSHLRQSSPKPKQVSQWDFSFR